MKKLFTVTALFFALLLSNDAQSQCAMCRRVAESSSEANENKVGRGLNTGILYLLSIPYILGGVGVFYWYKNRRKAD